MLAIDTIFYCSHGYICSDSKVAYLLKDLYDLGQFSTIQKIIYSVDLACHILSASSLNLLVLFYCV